MLVFWTGSVRKNGNMVKNKCLISMKSIHHLVVTPHFFQQMAPPPILVASCSRAEQRIHHLSLQSPLEASPNEAKSSSGGGHGCSPVRQETQNNVLRSHPLKEYDGREKSQDIGVFRRNAGKFQDSSSSSAYNLSRQQKVLGSLQQCDRSAYDLKSVSEMGQQPSFDKLDVVGKPNTERNQSTKQPLRSPKTKLNAADQDCPGREESVVVIMPRDQSETSCSGLTTSSYFAGNSRFSVEPGPKNISGRSSFGDLLPSKVDSCGRSTGLSSRDLEGVISSSQATKTPLQIPDNFHDTSRIGTQTFKGASQASHTFSFPVRMLSSPSRRPSRSRKTEEKKPVAGLQSVTAAKPSDELDNAGSGDNSPVRMSSSKDCTGKSPSVGATVSAPIDNPCSDKPFAYNNRGRSSPLRRLLDPVLKSRDSNNGEPCKTNSSPAVGTRKSCSDRVDFCNSVKLKSTSAGGSMTTVTDLHHNSTSEIQGPLQVSFKNGFPLFTFAIDNGRVILAGTVRNSFVPSKESMQEASCADSNDDSQNHHFPRRSNFITTVILPGGVHTVPSKGEISTFLHRWRSGGLCDCGGWDLGCQLLIYTNKREYERNTGSFVACPNRQRPAELSEPSHVAEKITNEVGGFEMPSGMKTLNHQVDVPA
ncbi:hypothetical protein Cgig2_004982 [Carnegiea gigantea]|uniref:Uncharacterized protein n=1 Tax=Carnegiea gigantea TaxID=171969 RepID=A0A9Q1L1G9_9CARY|nr:hypothetical protein Cgig2_004982 [Carnegiea gigantea]